MPTATIPESVQKYKPDIPCVKIRDDNGKYYVYKYQSKKLKSGKWSTTNYLIGKIIPGEGFFPNKRYTKENAEKNEEAVFYDGITDVAYGPYALLMSLSSDVYDQLKECFLHEMASQIYCYALIQCVNDFTYIDQIDDYYQESILSLKFKNYSFKMGYSALSSLLHYLGSHGDLRKKFEQTLLNDSSKNIAIDGHVIRSCSNENDLAEAGYKMSQIKAPQVNVLIAFDVKTKLPLMYRTYRGSSVDKTAVISFLESRQFTGVKFIVDRGFYSQQALDLMSKDGNSYIIPVLENNKHFKRIKATLEYSSGEFVYEVERKKSSRIIYYREEIAPNKNITFYKDVDENNSKRKSYQKHIALGDSGYTQEQYEEYCEWWGVYCLESVTGNSAEEDFNDYKSRWGIETYNNYIKNDARFVNLKIQDYYVQHGFDFIMLVTGIIHQKLNAAVVSLKNANISTYDILMKSGHMRMVRNEQEKWIIHNTRNKDIELLQKLGFTPEKEYLTVDAKH